MILTCPSCATRYVVKDDAIPPEGRTVRCAQCKHSWHQDPEPAEAPSEGELPPPAVDEAAPASEQAPADVAEEQETASGHPLGEPGGTDQMGELGDHAHPDVAAEPTSDEMDATVLPDPAIATAPTEMASTPEASAPFTQEQERDWNLAAAAAEPEAEAPRPTHPLRAARTEEDDLYSPFAAEEDAEGGRKRRAPLIILVLLVLVAAIAAGIWFLAPTEFKNRLGLAQASGETPLLVQVQQHSRQELASGNQLLEVSGMVINPTDQTQVVPPLNAQLRSLEQQVVYKWTIPPPAPRLAPGGSASFNSANLNIPAAAACLEVFFGRQQRPPVCKDGAAVGA